MACSQRGRHRPACSRAELQKGKKQLGQRPYMLHEALLECRALLVCGMQHNFVDAQSGIA